MNQMIIANWKMNLSFETSILLCENIIKQQFSRSLIIAASTPYIAYLQKIYKDLNFCAQDVSLQNDFGSYTSENCAKSFKSCSVNWAIIGHADRRVIYKETNEIVGRKVQNCLDQDMIPIVCIGEHLEIRQKNQHKDFLVKQLDEILSHTRITNNKKIIIAYEPIWAIGRKINPNISEIQEILDILGNLDYKLELVYGGSVTSQNSKDILSIPNLTGLLVGSASLNINELLKILNS